MPIDSFVTPASRASAARCAKYGPGGSPSGGIAPAPAEDLNPIDPDPVRARHAGVMRGTYGLFSIAGMAPIQAISAAMSSSV